MSALCQKRTSVASFDHLVGERKQVRWYSKAERFGGLEVDDELEFRRLHHRQVSRLLTFENSAI
jgi:hypothetical protein